MRLNRYLTEKKVEAFGDDWQKKWIAKLNQWDKDLRVMTKLYNSLKADQSDLKNFLKAKKAFIIFANNFEKWVYKELLGKENFNSKDESGFSKDVRTKAWDFLHAINANTLFPEEYDYEAKKHLPAPQSLDIRSRDSRKQNITRYQRHWRLTIESIKDLITYQAEAARELKDEQIMIGGISVAIKNIHEKDWSEKYIKKLSKHLPQAIQAVKKAGLAKSIRDWKLEVNFIPDAVDGIQKGGLTSGAYDHRTDILYLFPLSQNEKISDSTLIHEIGHRYWFKYVPKRAQKAWEDKINSQMTTIEDHHIKQFIDRYWDKERNNYMYSDQIKKDIEKNIKDPSLKVIFAYLSGRTPAFFTDTEKEQEEKYKNHLYKFCKGEQIPLEWISDYGRTNPAEAFAEAFKLWVGGVKGKLGEWTRAFFKEIVSTGGANIKEEKQMDLVEKYLREETLRSNKLSLPKQGKAKEFSMHSLNGKVEVIVSSETPNPTAVSGVRNSISRKKFNTEEEAIKFYDKSIQTHIKKGWIEKDKQSSLSRWAR